MPIGSLSNKFGAFCRRLKEMNLTLRFVEAQLSRRAGPAKIGRPRKHDTSEHHTPGESAL